MAKNTKTYPALVLTQNQHRFYFTTIPVDDLFPYCFVARREDDPEVGFQRALSAGRAGDIALYLAAGDGSIPTNIVLSAQEGSEFTYNSRAKTISFSRVGNAFLVLDGQHRLWGYQKCGIRHRVPVAIYSGLSRNVETKLFIDINTNQRGVPASLLLDIRQLAQMESARDSLIRGLFDKLNADRDSALNGKLSPAKSQL
jgi:DGQHR domain-containing protein